jgi:1-pyrroline-5-carboxylate dehydrogenase
MEFRNERTYLNLVEEGKEDEFHRNYEEAVKIVEEHYLGKEYPLIIGGREVFVEDKMEVNSPIDRRIKVGVFQKAKRGEIEGAIKEALKAFEYWMETDYLERVKIFNRIADEISREKYVLSAIITFENGKNRFEAVAEVDEAIDYFRYYSYLLEKNNGYNIKMGKLYKDEVSYSIIRPYGIWAIISPFNFPAAILTNMLTGATIMGNTAIVKPSSDTPLTAYFIIKKMLDSGIPEGVVNLVTSPGADFADVIVNNDLVSGIAFTGSKEVGYSLFKAFTRERPKPMVVELGGKNAVVVTEKADLDKASTGVMRGAFGFGGQKCSATSRVYVFEGVKESFVSLLIEKTRKIKIGDPREREVYLGPLISRGAVEKYERIIRDIERSGGKVLYGGKVLSNMEHGNYVMPAIVDSLPDDHWAWKAELFVPILLVGKVKDLKEAIRKVNEVEYGLTAGIFSKDENEIREFFNKVEAGVVYANRVYGATTGANVGVNTFGGWKGSGITGKNAGGPYYLIQYGREQSRTLHV